MLSPHERPDMITKRLSWLDENCAPERHAAAIVQVWRDARAPG